VHPGIPHHCSLLCVHQDVFFALAQSELGDVYMIKLDCTGTIVTNVRVRYFDTLPTAIALCISKFGLLFTASEYSNQYVMRRRCVPPCADRAVVTCSRVRLVCGAAACTSSRVSVTRAWRWRRRRWMRRRRRTSSARCSRRSR
jgi:hypothetical protein